MTLTDEQFEAVAKAVRDMPGSAKHMTHRAAKDFEELMYNLTVSTRFFKEVCVSRFEGEGKYRALLEKCEAHRGILLELAQADFKVPAPTWESAAMVQSQEPTQ